MLKMFLTVKDAIKALQEFDPDASIAVQDYTSWYSIENIEQVEEYGREGIENVVIITYTKNFHKIDIPN